LYISIGVFDVQKLYQFLYWYFAPALTDTMPGLHNHPTAAYGSNASYYCHYALSWVLLCSINVLLCLEFN